MTKTDPENKNKMTGRRLATPLLLLLLLAGSVAVQRSGWSHTAQLACTWSAFFLVIVVGICHGRRRQKEAAAARRLQDERKIGEMQALLQSLKRNSICLAPAPAADSGPLPAGASKYGGQPDLPTGCEWPRDNTGRPLSLLLQIECAELAAYDPEGLFPAAGHLYFFYELSAMEQDNRNRVAQVLYNEAPSQALRPLPFPDDLPEACRIAEQALCLSARESVPRCDDLFLMGLYSFETDLDAYEETARRMGLPPVSNALGTLSGYADTIQCSMLTDTPEEDILLLQLFSTFEDEVITPLMFGDCGNIYFYTTRRQLAERDFDHVRFEWQCF